MKQKINGCIYDHVWQVFLRFMNELKIITFFWEFEFFANSNSILSTSIWIINTLNLWSEKVIYENFFYITFLPFWWLLYLEFLSLSLSFSISISLYIGLKVLKDSTFQLNCTVDQSSSLSFSALSQSSGFLKL